MREGGWKRGSEGGRVERGEEGGNGVLMYLASCNNVMLVR